ncbi:Gfo/Idh/MocA family protein [Streptacidiphilus monticola]|uniref:Gfo/Idh/MocA family protein n=1 Tax=Streptacidiphilus monticola TaxID=2161674 RepID=A0ABW1FZ11_9ACTN
MSRTGPVGLAVVGAGNISGQYLRNLTAFPDVEVLAVADLDDRRAAQAAAEYGIGTACSPAAALEIPEVEIVVNLTVPAAHAQVALAALRAGKHVYGEKPLALDPESGRAVLAEAAARGLRVGNAPDTFLGAGIQSARRAVEAGLIGEPVAATVALESMGPEGWHPDPAFFYLPGAGPLFDMGPYYLTALVSLLGPVSSVAATARMARQRRVVGSGPLAGTEFPVEVPTHVTALLEFAAGCGASTAFSFDSPAGKQLLELGGTEATLALPDPNTFGGPLRIRGPKDREWRELPLSGTEAGRGIGVVDLARSLRAGQPHRASGELGLHVLDIMATIVASAAEGSFQKVTSVVPATDALPASWDPSEATL